MIFDTRPTAAVTGSQRASWKPGGLTVQSNTAAGLTPLRDGLDACMVLRSM